MHLLRIDSAAALLAGLCTLVFAPLLARWYGLPLPVLQVIALANLLYGCFSGWLLTRPGPRPMWAIRGLVLANSAWVAVCVALAARFHASATWLGLGHLLLEAAFVGTLAASEWRQRHRLQAGP